MQREEELFFLKNVKSLVNAIKTDDLQLATSIIDNELTNEQKIQVFGNELILQRLVRSNSIEMVKLFLDFGLDPNTLNEEGNTLVEIAFDLAVIRPQESRGAFSYSDGTFRIVKLLISYGGVITESMYIKLANLRIPEKRILPPKSIFHELFVKNLNDATELSYILVKRSFDPGFTDDEQIVLRYLSNNLINDLKQYTEIRFPRRDQLKSFMDLNLQYIKKAKEIENQASEASRNFLRTNIDLREYNRQKLISSILETLEPNDRGRLYVVPEYKLLNKRLREAYAKLYNNGTILTNDAAMRLSNLIVGETQEDINNLFIFLSRFAGVGTRFNPETGVTSIDELPEQEFRELVDYITKMHSPPKYESVVEPPPNYYLLPAPWPQISEIRKIKLKPKLKIRLKGKK